MGIIRFSDDPDDSWGAASRLIYDILVYSIGKTGKKRYLLNFRKEFDYRFNMIDLSPLDSKDLKEFRNLVAEYRDSRAYESLGMLSDSVIEGLNELLEKIDRLIVSRKIN